MSISDPIANALTNIRNAIHANKSPAIIGLRRISRPGLRKYVDNTKVPHVLNGLGTAVISTSKGVLTDREARKLSVGGELICYIW